MAAANEVSGILSEILASVKALQVENNVLASRVDEINGKVNVLASLKQVHEVADTSEPAPYPSTYVILTFTRSLQNCTVKCFKWVRDHQETGNARRECESCA
jgi:hypothetical protein